MRYWIVMLWLIVASLPLIAQEDPSPEPSTGSRIECTGVASV